MANSILQEVVTITFADVYKVSIKFKLMILDLLVYLPGVKYVHPQALYRNFMARMNDPSVQVLPFDLKLEAAYWLRDFFKL